MRVRHFYLLIPFLLVGAVSVAFSFQSGEPQTGPLRAVAMCRVESAVGMPSWIPTGVWRNDSLLVVDVVNRKLTQISKTGVGGEFRAALGEHLAGSPIIRIREGAPGRNAPPPFVVEFAGGKLLDVDRSLVPRRRLEMATDDLKSGENKMAMLIDWVQSGDGREIIGFADIEGPGQDRYRFKNGFVRFKLDDPGSFSIVHDRPFPDDARVSMLLTYPLIASIGSTGYVALVDDQMRLWRFGPQDAELQPMPLEAFPAHLRGKLAPMLPSFVGWEDFPALMEAVEQAEMPAGLFAWEKSLYLLSRRFEKDQRQWFLSRIDPQGESLLWTVRVPGSAHHMTVIPGQHEWAFLEKGRVAGHLNQATHHIRFVKSDQMRSRSLSSLCN